MNDLGVVLLGLAGRVTVLGAVAVALYAMLARRRPALAERVTALFPICLVLMSVLAFCPLPAWWAWGQAEAPPVPALLASERREGPSASALAEDTAPVSGESRLAFQVGDAWCSAWRQAERALERSPRSAGWDWQAWLASAFLGGATLALLRLLLGLWAIRACRRAPLIEDEELLRLVDELRADLGCSPVELREGVGLSAPATVGWWHPVVLLPADWREWSADDRRAALAHELAHVRRRDYLVRLLARLAAVGHFYHPLVWWLQGRLELQQELAADNLAAGCVGGRERYLRALARLALRAAGPDRRELSVSMTGTLLRRVAMLQARDGEMRQAKSWLARLLLFGLLAGLVLGTSTLRSPAEKGRAGATTTEAPAAPAGKGRAGRELAAFDISFVPASTSGVFAIRPHAFMDGLAGSKYAPSINSLVNQNIAATCRAQGLHGSLLPPVEKIEQFVGPFRFEPIKSDNGTQTAVMFGLGMVRTLDDFDWKKFLRAAMPGAVEVRHAGKAYFRAPKGAITPFGPNFSFHVVDRRTVVFSEEASLRAWFEKGPDARSRPWAADWKRVERGLVAVALDLRDRRWLDQRRQPDENMTADQVALFRSADSLVFGLDFTATRFSFQGLGRAKTNKGAAALARAGRSVLAELAKSAQDEPGPRPALQERFIQGMLRKPQIERDGKVVRWRGEVKVGFADLAEAFGNSGEW